MKPVKLKKSQFGILKRLMSGMYHPRPRPSTHDNATFRALERQGAIVAGEADEWLPGPMAKEFLGSGGHLRGEES